MARRFLDLLARIFFSLRHSLQRRYFEIDISLFLASKELLVVPMSSSPWDRFFNVIVDPQMIAVLVPHPSAYKFVKFYAICKVLD